MKWGGATNPVGQSGLDRRTGMQGAHHDDGVDGDQGQLRGHVIGDAGQAQDLDMQFLAGRPDRLQVLPAVMTQAQLQGAADHGLVDHLGMGAQLIADRRANEVGAVGIEALLHQQIDLSQIDEAQVDGDLLGFTGLGTNRVYAHEHPHRIYLEPRRHPNNILLDGVWMVEYLTVRFCQAVRLDFQSDHSDFLLNSAALP